MKRRAVTNGLLVLPVMVLLGFAIYAAWTEWAALGVVEMEGHGVVALVGEGDADDHGRGQRCVAQHRRVPLCATSSGRARRGLTMRTRTAIDRGRRTPWRDVPRHIVPAG
jgi:hypothetical protein